jgi:hypothetical protein
MPKKTMKRLTSSSHNLIEHCFFSTLANRERSSMEQQVDEGPVNRRRPKTSRMFADPRIAVHRQPVALFVFLLLTACLAFAQIDRQGLGARFDSTGSQVEFRVYSSRATRIELYLHAQPAGADEAAHLPLELDSATSVWLAAFSGARLVSSLLILGRPAIFLSCSFSAFDGVHSSYRRREILRNCCLELGLWQKI